MDPRVQEILDKATSNQQDYVIARLTHPNMSSAARSAGLHKTTPLKWTNLDELEEAVTILRRDVIEAARLALEGLALDAVATLGKVLEKGNDAAAVSAAKAVFDRIGLPAQSQMDVTSGGESLRATVYIPDNDRDDRD